uniref:JmjC domain-containing protein n=1 Tax=Rhizochromulina marina TaxID=1034831 RepID=A0A7S2RPG9_9STRA|mmetsp:Transcript_19180/g.55758  ORF Transcript_19180/g.55758 Transcript_19180/m.55758 type:complete len:403 (+) Transcript_19180:290-1498(+)
MVEIQRVPVADLSGDQFLRDFVLENKPVVLTGGLDHWKPLDWTPEYLESLALESGKPDARVVVAPLQADREHRHAWLEPSSRWGIDPSQEDLPGVLRPDLVLALSGRRVAVPLSHFTSMLRGHERMHPAYADGSAEVAGSLSFLYPDYCCLPPALEGFALKLRRKKACVWLGRHSTSSLHFDNVENFFAQAVGSKRFLLVPPHYSSILVQGRLRKAAYHFHPSANHEELEPQTREELDRDAQRDGPLECGLEPHDAFTFRRGEVTRETVLNYPAFPISKPPLALRDVVSRVPCSEVEVGPGEVLYLPAMWWHEVTAVPNQDCGCASVSYMFHPVFSRSQPQDAARLGQVVRNPVYEEFFLESSLTGVDPPASSTSTLLPPFAAEVQAQAQEQEGEELLAAGQ